jgi:signal peptidase I
MNDTLVLDDRILVQKVSYWGSASPERGDIVVFADPGGWLDDSAAPQPRNALAKGLEVFGLFPTGGHLVKRVIGVGGDTVRCCDSEGRLEINGQAVDEDDFIAPQPECDGPMPSGCRRDWVAEVPEGKLFVMGDNRANSLDSRFGLGFVPIDRVIGKAVLVIWPPGHMGDL